MRLPLIALVVTFFVGACQTSAPSSDLRLWYTKPADPDWKKLESLPVGSGRMGALIFGGMPTERIQFNEDTLWTGQPHDYVREGALEQLPKIREAVFADSAGPLVPMIREKFLSDPIRQKAYQPFGDIWIDTGHKDVSDYRRQLDLDSAVASVTYRVNAVQYTREVFASYPDNAIVVRLTASKAGSI